jgi:hypothetical protein
VTAPTGRLRDVLASSCAVLGVPGTTDTLGLAALAGEVRQLVVFLVDGLGYHLLPAAAPAAPVLADVLAGRLGSLTELACSFPSTTPTSLVTLGTGAEPGEHGVLGFTLALPGTDRVLTHVAWWGDPPPEQWQPVPSLLDRAVAAGVSCAIVTRPQFRHSGLTVSAYGTEPAFFGAPNLGAIAEEVRAALGRGVELVYAYHPSVDTMMHLHGVGSPEWLASVTRVDATIAAVADELPAGAALLVIADHGGLNVSPSARVDAGTDTRLSAGVRVVAGEPRVRYVHCRPGAAADVAAAWSTVLGDAAQVLEREEAIETGWFGPVAPRNRERIGDLVAVCTGDAAVLATGWGEPDRVTEMVGMHGSVTPVETAVPLITIRK